MGGNVLLENCSWVVTQNRNRDVLRDKHIIIEDGKVKAITGHIERSKRFDRVIDCKGKVVLPALINGHTHAAMTLLRGYNDDTELHDWLNSVWRVEAKLTGRDVEAGTLLACLEMLKTGTCCFVDMYFFMEDAAKAVEKAGMKALLGYGMLDFGNEEKRKEELRECKKLLELLKKKGNKRLRGVVAPHAIYTCSAELLQESMEIAKSYDVLYTIHLSETRKEVHECFRTHRKYPVEYLDDLGVLNDRFVGFHAAWLTRNEISLLARKGGGVVHCPVSNMKLATGGAFPFREYIKAGVLTALGTDGACSNNSLNMLEEMKFAALLQKWFRWNAREMSAQQALDMATVNASKLFRLNNGSVEPEKDADLLVLNAGSCFMLPHHNMVSNIVYASSYFTVEHVLIDGDVVIEQGKHTALGEEGVMSIFLKRVESLMERAETGDDE